MPPESPRIAELRRRVEADPSSIAFAQLAEEYRRVGNFDAAEQCCRTGLTRHPGYLSARVTLGRTLIELNKLAEAEQELDFVLKSAPDNLAAIRGMAEIHQRRGHLEFALHYYRRALPLARHDPELEESVRQIHRDLAVAKPELQAAGLSFKEAQEEFLAALSRLPQVPARPAPIVDAPAAPPAPIPEPPPPEPGPVAAAPPGVAALDVETPIDFDGLLKSLGVPDHQPPPIVEALIPEPTFSEALPPVADIPDPPAAPVEDRIDAEVLDELEAWLAAIRR